MRFKLTNFTKLIFVSIFTFSLLGFFPQQVHAVNVWTAKTSAGQHYWYSITSSADGTKLAAVDLNGYIYTSTDSGATWTEQTSAGQRSWYSITSSADGTKLVAVDNNLGYIYTSTDSGATWTEQTSSGQRYWRSITSSADGTKLAAVDSNLGYIYTSTDSGATWTEQTSAGQRYWASITSSADGTKLVAGDPNDGSSGYIYTSTDSGATWTEQTSAGQRNWYSITSSSDGTKLAAVDGNGYIYTSADSGATWTEQTSAGQRPWQSITSSSDGTKLAAGDTSPGYIYTYGPPTAPTLTTTSPTSVTPISATLNGNIASTGGENATVRGFEYGTTISYGTTTTENGDFETGDFSADISSLTPDILYHYRSYATNSVGTSYGSDQTFMTRVWTQRTNSGPRSWQSITSSSDGTKLAAVEYNGYIYTSTNSGATWTAKTSAGQRSWISITSSADGTKLAAVDGSPGYIYTSTDSGATWTEQTSAGQRNWYSITSSADGTKLAAVEYNGYIYTSTDSGATWTEQTSSGQRSWTSITSSSDGTKLVAVDNNLGYIYTSTDSGATWTEQTSSGQRYWFSITSSADGTKLAAMDGNLGYIYTSTDSGATWTAQTSAGQRYWYSITSSSDGTKLAAADPNDGSNGYIYTSTDSGATWTEQTSAGQRNWYSITSSADGTKLAAVDSNSGYIYTYGPLKTLVVNTLLDNNNGTCTTDPDGCSLRDAIATSQSADTITFSVTGTILLTEGSSMPVNHSLTITGPGASTLTIDFGGVDDANYIEQNAGILNISGLTITHGDYPIYSNSGDVHISDMVFNENNQNSAHLYMENGDLTITNSTFSNNSSNGNGGAIVYYGGGGSLTITNSTFSNNSSTGNGGAIYIDGDLTITNSTFSNNSSNDNGGAIYIDGGTATITNSTFSGNTAISGGAIYSANGDVNVVNSIFYGTDNCYGTITSLGHNIDSGGTCGFDQTGDLSNPTNFSRLHSFNGTNGAYPRGSLIESNGVFYGMAYDGGANDYGTVFSFNPVNVGSEYTVIHSFDSTNGSYPLGSLIESNGVFYGMANEGGANSVGTIFSYNPANIGSEYSVLHEFDDTNGSYPWGSLIESNGVFYGVTNEGGANGYGTIFSYNPANIGSEYSVLHEFDSINGRYPKGSLIESNGVFYGMTQQGGTDFYGTIFSYNPVNVGSEYTVIHSFDNTNGANPNGSLIESNGVFYGMTYGGGANDYGTVFSFNPVNVGSEYTVIHSFDSTNGSYPYGSLIESNGVFYGMANEGGTEGIGTIFSYDLTPTQLYDPASIFASAGLQDNGGPVKTIALLSSSPAINAGDDNSAPATDARGYSRVGVSDIGAYEYQPVVVVRHGGGGGGGLIVQNTEKALIKEQVKFQFLKNLKLGIKDNDVKELQRYLNTNGFLVSKTGPGSKGYETNKFGPATRSALIKFQKARKIVPAVGFFGPLTRAAINK